MNSNDLNFDEDYKEQMAPVMVRQRHKSQLISSTNKELDMFSRYKALWGKKYNRAIKDVLKDYFKGVRVINKKNPIFAEMPKLVPVGNGLVKQVYDNQSVDEVTDVDVNLPLNADEPNSIDLPKNLSIEDKKS